MIRILHDLAKERFLIFSRCCRLQMLMPLGEKICSFGWKIKKKNTHSWRLSLWKVWVELKNFIKNTISFFLPSCLRPPDFDNFFEFFEQSWHRKFFVKTSVARWQRCQITPNSSMASYAWKHHSWLLLLLSSKPRKHTLHWLRTLTINTIPYYRV